MILFRIEFEDMRNALEKVFFLLISVTFLSHSRNIHAIQYSDDVKRAFKNLRSAEFVKFLQVSLATSQYKKFKIF